MSEQLYRKVVEMMELRKKIESIRNSSPNLSEECEDMEHRLLEASVLISSVKNWVELEAILKNPHKREIVKKVGEEG